jgi:hypothetical protein
MQKILGCALYAGARYRPENTVHKIDGAHKWIQDTIVGVVTQLRHMIWGRFPAEDKYFFFSFSSEFHPFLYVLGTWGYFPRSKATKMYS